MVGLSGTAATLGGAAKRLARLSLLLLGGGLGLVAWLGLFLYGLLNLAPAWAAGVAVSIGMPLFALVPVYLALDELSGLAGQIDALKDIGAEMRAKGLAAGFAEWRSLRGLLRAADTVDGVVSKQAAMVFLATPLAAILAGVGILGFMVLCALGGLALLLVPWLV